jgi:hypothetical protein
VKSPFAGLTADEEVMLRAQTGNIFVDLADGNVPVGNAGSKGVWSLLSLILALAAASISVIMSVGAFFSRRRRDDGEYDMEGYAGYSYDEGGVAREYGDRRVRGRAMSALAGIFGALTLIVWRILDSLTTPMTWINQWTLIVAILFAAQVTCIVIYRVVKADRARTRGQGGDGSLYTNSVFASAAKQSRPDSWSKVNVRKRAGLRRSVEIGLVFTYNLLL